MFTVMDVLLTAGVKFSVYAGWAAESVYMTDANQLIGSYRDLEAFRASDSNYSGWHVHHVVEDDDLHRLGVSMHAPAYPDQLCVLIPERAQHPATGEPDQVPRDRSRTAPGLRGGLQHYG